jgi:hypothetical protein
MFIVQLVGQSVAMPSHTNAPQLPGAPGGSSVQVPGVDEQVWQPPLHAEAQQ